MDKNRPAFRSRLWQLKLLPFYVVGGSVMLTAVLVLFARPTANSMTTVACDRPGREIVVSIHDSGFRPREVRAQACDRLTFHNKGRYNRVVAFGQHDRHVAYPGLAETPLAAGRQVSFVLSAVGEFEYHDHFNESQGGRLVVEN